METNNKSDWFEFQRAYPSWDDLRFPATRIRQGALQKPDFDYTNMGLLFPSGDPTEVVSVIVQMPHSWVEGTEIQPHIHYLQDTAELPTFKMSYKWFDIGGPVPAEFTTVATTGVGVFEYTGSPINQLIEFPPIDGSHINLISSMLFIKLFRDDTAIAGDVLMYEFDMHYLREGVGSRYEFND